MKKNEPFACNAVAPIKKRQRKKPFVSAYCGKENPPVEEILQIMRQTPIAKLRAELEAVKAHAPGEYGEFCLLIERANKSP